MRCLHTAVMLLILTAIITLPATASTCYQYYEQDGSASSQTAYSAYIFSITDYANKDLISISGTFNDDSCYPRIGASKCDPDVNPFSFPYTVSVGGHVCGNGTLDIWWVNKGSGIYGYQLTFNDYTPYPGYTGLQSITLSGDNQAFYADQKLSSTPDYNTYPTLKGATYYPPDFTISYYYTCDIITPTPTPTPLPDNIAVNLLEKYSNAALINQAITITPTAGGAGETKTSLYGETLHFGVVPGMEYWFNASRAGYQDYNETYTIPASPGIYNVYMERTLTPIANHSYAHFSVVDQTNGGLIPNAEIRLSDGQTKLTNSAGYTWFSVNNSEQINYYVSKPSGYWPAYGALNITSDESILVALQRYTGPTATATMPGWTPVTVPTTGPGPVITLSAAARSQNIQEGMDVWYTNLPFISQFLFLLFIIGGLGLMAGGTRRN
jgi:hypothetical protein